MDKKPKPEWDESTPLILVALAMLVYLLILALMPGK